VSDRAPQAETARKQQLLAELTGRTDWSARSMPLDLLVHRKPASPHGAPTDD
jgi:hypothetical protein